MDKDGLLRTIAEIGYSAGFGARKTFSTYDIVEKAPGWIGFISFAIGTFALVFDQLAAKVPSALLLIAGVGSLYFGSYRCSEYEATAKQLLGIQNRLRNLYRSAQGGMDIDAAKSELDSIERDYHSITVSRQVFLSDWYAHYKFFGQTQIGWMDEQLQFGLWKDKVPFSAKFVMAVAAVVSIGWVAWLLFHAYCSVV